MSVARLSRPSRLLRTRKQKGFAMAFVLIMLILLSGLTYMSAATTGRTIKTAVFSRDFVESGQLADAAVQDAVYQLNEGNPSSLPTSASPKTGSNSTGTWSWYADPITAGLGGGRATTIHATGTFRNVTRSVTAGANSLNVGGFKVMADKQIQYEAGPAGAFSHTLLGRSIKAQNGAGVGSATPFLTGVVGVNGPGPLDLSTYSGLSSPLNVSAYLLYGGQAANLNVPSAIKIPAGIGLDSAFINDNLSRCGGAAPADWVSSRSGGILVANDNVACYASMLFDVPTTIVGTGAFNAFVTGAVTFNESAKASTTGTALNIYTNGNVTFNTTQPTGAPMEVRNTFVFAPKGACTTNPFRDSTKSLTFSGSLACDSINASGQFTGTPAVNPLGNDKTKDGSLYSREIWTLVDYKQPAGSRS